MSHFINPWTISGPIMIVVSLAIGFFRNKRNHCRVAKERYSMLPGRIFNISGAVVFVLLVQYVSGDGYLGLLQNWLPGGLEHTIMFISWLIALIAAFFILEGAFVGGEKLGRIVVAKLAERCREHCKSDISYASNCPRAGRKCPLANRVLKFESVPAGNGKQAYYIITNTSGEKIAVVERFPMFGDSSFVPLPHYNDIPKIPDTDATT